MSVEITLDEIERDALTELVNIGVSRAASSLRKMMDRQVLLLVPSLEMVERQAAAALIGGGRIESLTVIALIYFLIAFTLTRLVSVYERKLLQKFTI